MTTIKSQYYFTALDNFPYNIPECMEALNYALSYDNRDADALCLLGRVYSEILLDYEKAKQYFEEALQNDLMNINTPQFYLMCLLNNEDYMEAEKLINFSLKIKGVDKSNIWYHRAVLSEMRGSLLNSLYFLREAKKFCFNQSSLDFMEAREKFVRLKMQKKKIKKETN